MADQVNIENVGGDNGIASEITLQKLLAAMELMANKTGADNKMAIKKANEQYKKSISDLNKATKKGTGAREDNTEAVKDSTEAHRDHASMLSGPVMSALGKLSGSVLNLGNELLQGSNSIGAFSQHLPYVGKILGPFSEFVDNSIDTFRSLSASGASFNNSLVEMRYASAAAQLNLDEFAGLVTANTETLRMMGGTVQQGVRQFTNLNKELKDTGGFRELKTLGFTVEEINEGLLNYSQLQMRLGRSERMTQAQMAESASAYMKELNLMSKATGKRREELEQGMLENSVDASFRAMQNQFEQGSEGAENFQRSMMAIQALPPEFQTAMKDLADGVAQTDIGQKLAAVSPEIAEAARQIGAGADPQILLDALKGLRGVDEKILGGVGPTAAATAQALEGLVPGISTIANYSNIVAKVGEMDLNAAEKEAKATDGTTAALTTFEDSIRDLRAQIQTELLNTGVFQGVGNGLGYVNTALHDAAGGLREASAYIREFSEEDKQNLMDSAESFFTDPKVIGAGVAGIGVLFASAAIKSALASSIGGLFGSKGGVMSGKGGVRGGAGGGIGRGIGRGAGAAGAGALSGIAKGLSAFANPKVAAGAGVLAAVITGVGAAIAAATWMTGSALPVFAEGMASFETLDGDKLKLAGEGMLSIAGGLAAFGGASIVGGVGSLASSVTEGIAGLFGGDDPLEKLQRFGDLDLDVRGIERNAKAMRMFTDAFASMNQSGMMDFDVNDDAVELIEDLADVDGRALERTARGMKTLASVRGFEDTLSGLKDLDADNVENYRESLEDLVETLEKLNEQLAGGDSGFLGSDKPEYTAGDLLGQSSKTKSQDQVNTSALLRVLEEIRELNKRTLRAINESGNVY